MANNDKARRDPKAPSEAEKDVDSPEDTQPPADADDAVKGQDDTDTGADAVDTEDAAGDVLPEAAGETVEDRAQAPLHADGATEEAARDAPEPGADDPAARDDGTATTADTDGTPDVLGDVPDPRDGADDREAAQPGEAHEHQPPAEAAPEPVRVERVVERKGGFLAMLLGGAVAAALGYGAATYLARSDGDDVARQALEQEILDRISDQAQRTDALAERLEAVGDAPDLSGVEAAQAALETQTQTLSAKLSDLEARVAVLDERLNAVERRPIAEGASDSALAAYERDLRNLQEAMSEQRAEIAAMLEEARAKDREAEEAAQATMRRAALNRLRTALESGTPFEDVLSDLQDAGLETPGVLAGAAAEGVPTRDALEQAFPEAARAALAASRAAAAPQGEGGGFEDFLKEQLGLRSLTPRQGNDPDAVLSRAEAALREGRLDAALAETEALPEPGRAALSEWTARAVRRLEALAAAQALAETVN